MWILSNGSDFGYCCIETDIWGLMPFFECRRGVDPINLKRGRGSRCSGPELMGQRQNVKMPKLPRD